MRCLFQRFWHSTVRLEQNKLMVDITYLGSDKELCARMTAAPDTFVIQQAWWEVYRAPGFKAPVIKRIKGLEGVKAYFGSGTRLKEALVHTGFPEARELFAEGVRGIVQAETFLTGQRGFEGREEYEKYWNDMYSGACRYYSNLHRVTRNWYEHVGYSEREGALFNRFKNQTLHEDGSDILLTGHFTDSFHSVTVKLDLDGKEGRVKEARGEILRAPDPVCIEANVYMDKIKNTCLDRLNKKEIASLLGSGNGCVHLIDLVYDAAKTLNLYREADN